MEEIQHVGTSMSLTMSIMTTQYTQQFMLPAINLADILRNSRVTPFYR